MEQLKLTCTNVADIRLKVEVEMSIAEWHAFRDAAVLQRLPGAAYNLFAAIRHAISQFEETQTVDIRQGTES